MLDLIAAFKYFFFTYISYSKTRFLHNLTI